MKINYDEHIIHHIHHPSASGMCICTIVSIANVTAQHLTTSFFVENIFEKNNTR